MDDYRNAKQRAEALILANEKERERKIKMRKKKENNAAIKIQAMIRSYRCRVEIEEFIEERKIFKQLREEEAKTRNSLLYQILGIINMQPYLKSDTPKERLEKMFPAYFMNIVEESCDGNWTLAYKLIREQEEFEWKRDAETIRLRKNAHGSSSSHGHHHISLHQKLIMLREKRLAKQNLIPKVTPKRKRGKGYVRFHKPKMIQKGLKKLEDFRKQIEEENRVSDQIINQYDDDDDDDDGDQEENQEEKHKQSGFMSSQALADLAIGDPESEEKFTIDHTNFFSRILSKAKLKLSLLIAKTKYENLKQKVEIQEYCLSNLKNQFKEIEESVKLLSSTNILHIQNIMV